MSVPELRKIPLTHAGRAHLDAHPDDWKVLARCATDFRFFLDYWWVAPEGFTPRRLGQGLWAAQDEFVRVAKLHDWIFYLKARQLGESTIECAFDGWRLRFGGPNSRVHISSRTDVEAAGLLADVIYGLDRLPEWLRLPKEKDTTSEVVFTASPDGEDSRTIHAYPASSPGRGETCTHAHVDEWADTPNPKKIWSAVEPSVATGGTCHIVTTGMGPQNYTSAYWRKCMAGDTSHDVFPCFIDALQRPDRNPKWYEKAKRDQPDLAEFLREYPMTWEDALSGGGDLVFTSANIDACGIDFKPMLERGIPGRKYIVAWDIGRHADAAVGTVLDVTDDMHDVVHYLRLREKPYPYIQARIEEQHEWFPGLVVIEKNGPGEAVMENLNIPEYEVIGFTTSRPSKSRIIQGLNLAFQNQTLKWDPEACFQLDGEVRGYVIPDDNVVQDSVMSLAIAEEHASEAHTVGSVGKVTTW